MKICYIANSESSHTVKWARYFASKGNDVYIISHSNIQIPGIKVIYINYSIKNFLFKKKAVHKIIDNIKPDILHAQQANTCGLYASTTKKSKYVVSAWGSDILIDPKISIILKKIVQHVVKNAEYITSDSLYMTEEIVNLGGKRENIYTFPMGIDDFLLPYKHKFDIDNKVLNIVSLRRLEKLYNVDIIIDGFYAALKNEENINLTITADGSEINRLKEKVNSLGINNKVRFTGKYYPDELGEILSNNDIFFSIPDSDSTSVSLLEGMYCGLFPIVSNLPANKEWVKHLDNGYIIEKNDTESVKNAILWCYNNKNHIIEVSNKNIEIIKEKALWKNNVKIIENIYQKMLKNNRR